MGRGKNGGRESTTERNQSTRGGAWPQSLAAEAEMQRVANSEEGKRWESVKSSSDPKDEAEGRCRGAPWRDTSEALFLLPTGQALRPQGQQEQPLSAVCLSFP